MGTTRGLKISLYRHLWSGFFFMSNQDTFLSMLNSITFLSKWSSLAEVMQAGQNQFFCHCIHAKPHLLFCNSESVSWSLGIQKTMWIKVFTKKLSNCFCFLTNSYMFQFIPKGLDLSLKKCFNRINWVFLHANAITTCSSTMKTLALVVFRNDNVCQSNLILVSFCFWHLTSNSFGNM